MESVFPNLYAISESNTCHDRSSVMDLKKKLEISQNHQNVPENYFSQHLQAKRLNSLKQIRKIDTNKIFKKIQILGINNILNHILVILCSAEVEKELWSKKYPSCKWSNWPPNQLKLVR